MIKEAALLQGDKIYTGTRHCYIKYKMIEFGLKFKGGIQGFMDDQGNFLTRDQAEAHARACGQLTKPLIGSILTSEDLW